MSQIYWGEHLFGQVDRVPGLFYVATEFFHIQFLPLYPKKSYVVMEGPEDEFDGEEIPFNLKSVVAGYVRGFLAAVFLFAGMVASVKSATFYFPDGNAGGFAIAIAFLAFAGLYWSVLVWDSNWYWLIQTVILVAMAAAWLHIQAKSPQGPIRVDRRGVPLRADTAAREAKVAIPIAALALSLYSCTFTWSTISADRARELGQTLGLPPEMVGAYLKGNPDAYVPPPESDASSETETV